MTPVAAQGFAGLRLSCRRSERMVFTGLDFTVAAGGALLLTGPNGSGKSSLLRLMAGLIKPYSGRLDYNGTWLADDPARHREIVAYLGHQDAVKPMLTVGESTQFWAGLRGRQDKAEAAMAAMGLTELSDLAGRFLSSGQRRRTALARVIAGGAPVWLLDEPTVGLDVKSIAALESALAVHCADGGIVIAATHAPIALPGAVSLNLADFAPSGFANEVEAA
ncbi:MAG: heme transporter ATP-binding protein CcmA [Rhodospirillales bacterium]|nr:heme transporter ATP-binding protein CcmA [Rhodospirillales bacterium]